MNTVEISEHITKLKILKEARERLEEERLKRNLGWRTISFEKKKKFQTIENIIVQTTGTVFDSKNISHFNTHQFLSKTILINTFNPEKFEIKDSELKLEIGAKYILNNAGRSFLSNQ